MTPEQIIEGGIEAIQTYGHRKDSYGSTVEGFCAMGSICHAFAMARQLADADYGSLGEAQNRLRATLHASGYRIPAGHSYTDNVPAFNDDPATTAEDVILMMKKAL
jgi:hypothetical protein